MPYKTNCEICDKRLADTLIAGVYYCLDCKQKENKLQVENESNAENRALESHRQTLMNQLALVDAKIEVRSEIFNSQTKAIVELKSSIDSNDSITNKSYALAQALDEHYKMLRKAAFELNEQQLEITNKQRAIQSYLNELANKLHKDEREKLRLSDISYQPTPIKDIKPKVSKPKAFDKVELRKYASELGVAEYTLQMLCVSQGISVEEAANKLRKTIAESKSEAGIN